MRTFTKLGTFVAVLLVGVIAFLIHTAVKPMFNLPTGKGRAAVAFGDSHGVILASDGSLWVWGEALSGWPSLGLGKVGRQRSLRQLGTDTNWVDVVAGGSHNL